MKLTHRSKEIITQLINKGVQIPCPESIEVGDEINSQKISGKGVIIHSGCKLYGADTLIMDGVELGYEAPATIHNCQLGNDVKLKGGAFSDSSFLDKASIGSGAQIREACLFEEGAHGGHNVGLKQTILFPYVTLGSLINFCDCLMAGGTDEKNHSEVGSSYIHFNYTPNQDKATASMLGDVPRGVMINQKPIFLGGQGGLVGPLRIAYGTIIAAGTIARKDILKEDTLLLGHPAIVKSIPFTKGRYSNLKRIITLNSYYISSILTLRRWYIDVRLMFTVSGSMAESLLKGAIDKLDKAIDERIKRLNQVAQNMTQSIKLFRAEGSAKGHFLNKCQEFHDQWPAIEQVFQKSKEMRGDSSNRESFLEIIENKIHINGKNYLEVIKGLDHQESQTGTSWLQGLINAINKQVWELLPGLNIKGV